MNRAFPSDTAFAVCKVAMLTLAAVVAAPLAPLAAEPAAAEADAGLPLSKIVLFTSGVGYFQHDGQVAGDATVEMSFRAEEINDLLKSLVAQDLSGGTAAPSVRYASRDPVSKTLATFAVDLTDDPSLGTLLGRLRGRRVELDAAAPASGTILGVERRKVASGDDATVEKEFLTVLTDEGLRTLPLEGITRIRLADEALQAELEQALAVLALARDTQSKAVAIRFPGKAARRVRVGYVREMPLWKTSYRLVIGESDPEQGKAKAFLQGWAIVENTTDRDWQGVRLSLVSGRPISFRMDLYRPLYVPRPEVAPELFASLSPQVYGQGMEDEKAEFLARKSAERENGRRQRAAGMAADVAASPMAPAGRAAEGFEGEALAESGLFAGSGGRGGSMAEAAALGEFFRYEISQPVSLARQQSAMLPIVSADVEVEKLAVYDERVLAKHPLSGVRLINSTDVSLMQGPITVYEADAYAGDARIEDLPPGSSRLLTYAVDLDVEVVARGEAAPERLTSVRLSKGTLVATRKLTRSRRYELKNSGSESVRLLVTHPIQPGWKLVEPSKPAETTRNDYRFAVTAAPGEPTTLTVREERVVEQRLGLANLDDAAVLFYVNAKTVDPAVKQALSEVIERKRAIQKLVVERKTREKEIAGISQEQSRIRENMARLDRASNLYARYVQKFGEQESRIEDLREAIAELTDREQKARESLDTYLLGLDLDG